MRIFNKYTIPLAAVFCTSLFFSCTSNIEPPPPLENLSSPSAQQVWNYCVTAVGCLEGPFTASTCTGQLSNSCPNGSSPSEGGSSSSVADGGSSSSITSIRESSSSVDDSSSSPIGSGSSSSITSGGSSSSSLFGSSSSAKSGVSSSSVATSGGSSSSSAKGGGSSLTGTSGTFIDDRDNKSYKWVKIGEQYLKIGEQYWMAENLNYNASGSKCYDGSSLTDANTTHCDTYGRLYNWATAMDLPSKCNNTPKDADCAIKTVHKGICPTGWHIPNQDDYDPLYEYAGGFFGASCNLKANSGWREVCTNTCNYTDSYGFSALPGGGSIKSDGSFSGGHVSWWLSSYYRFSPSPSHCFISLDCSADIYIPCDSDDNRFKNSLLSVRCVKD